MTVQSPILSGLTATKRLPEWFRQELPDTGVHRVLERLDAWGVRTVCQHASCPNLTRCLKQNELTFMILGDTCTRTCRFCAVSKYRGQELPVEEKEARSLAFAAEELNLDYTVITSVTRDDLADGGCGAFAASIREVKSLPRHPKVEVLIPDFRGERAHIAMVLQAGPDVLAHNIETVKRLYPFLRPEADYERSLKVLRTAKEIDPQVITKSSLMLGLGEERREVLGALRDLRSNQCDIVTLGQYLAPSAAHYPVQEFIHPQVFAEYKKAALGLGFKVVCAGPLVRSSYKAQDAYYAYYA